MQVSELFAQESSGEPMEMVAAQFYEAVTLEVVTEQQRLIILPLDNPVTWTSLMKEAMAVLAVQVQLPGIGGGLVLQVVGESGDDLHPIGLPEEMRLTQVPGTFITARPSINGIKTKLEKLIGSIVEEAQGREQSGGGVAVARAGGSVLRGDVVKKFAGCRVIDLNGNTHDLMNKEGAAKRVGQLSVLIREMTPQRREVLCPDLTFNMDLFWSECMRHVERKQDATDPLYSIAGVKDLLHLPVCKDHEVLQHHLLEGQSADDWTRSLWDFVEGEEGWGKGLDVVFKRNLLRAFEAWVEFQCVFKGLAFQVILQPVLDLFKDQGRILEEYGAEFVWYQLEIVIREYRYEIVTTRGRVSRRIGAHAIVDQPDCVTFLLSLIRDMVDDARGGRWEKFPHPRFYAPGSRFSLVRLPGKNGQGGPRGGHGTVVDKGREREENAHKHGTCMWHVAGAMNLINRKTGEPFKCRDENRKHVALKKIPLGTMRELLKDPEFMACRYEGIKNEIATQVEKKKHLFGK
jgi:hypothetical protein